MLARVAIGDASARQDWLYVDNLVLPTLPDHQAIVILGFALVGVLFPHCAALLLLLICATVPHSRLLARAALAACSRQHMAYMHSWHAPLPITVVRK